MNHINPWISLLEKHGEVMCKKKKTSGLGHQQNVNCHISTPNASTNRSEIGTLVSSITTQLHKKVIISEKNCKPRNDFSKCYQKGPRKTC